MQLRLAAPPTGQKARNPVPRDSVPGRPRPPERLKHRAAGSGPQAKSLRLGRFRAHQAQGRLGVRFPNRKPGRLNWSAGCALRAQNTVTNPKWRDYPAASARVPSQSGRRLLASVPSPGSWSHRLHVPRTKLRDWLINGLIACQGPHLQRLPNKCAPYTAF